MRLSELEELLGSGQFATPWSSGEVRETLQALEKAGLVTAERPGWPSLVDAEAVATVLIGLSARTPDEAAEQVEYYAGFAPAMEPPFVELSGLDFRSVVAKILSSPINASNTRDITIVHPPQSACVIRFSAGDASDPIGLIFTVGGQQPDPAPAGAWRQIVYEGVLIAMIAEALEEWQPPRDPSNEDKGWADELPDYHPLRRVLGGKRKKRA